MKRTFQIAANNFKQKQINYIWNIIIFVIVMNLNLTFTSLVGRQVSLDYEFSNYALYRWHLNSSGYRRLRIFWNICDWFELQNERTRFCRPYRCSNYELCRVKKNGFENFRKTQFLLDFNILTNERVYKNNQVQNSKKLIFSFKILWNSFLNTTLIYNPCSSCPFLP